jgi:hypothetical protein
VTWFMGNKLVSRPNGTHKAHTDTHTSCCPNLTAQNTVVLIEVMFLRFSLFAAVQEEGVLAEWDLSYGQQAWLDGFHKMRAVTQPKQA